MRRDMRPHHFYLDLSKTKTKRTSSCLKMNYSSNGVRNLTLTHTWKIGKRLQLLTAAMAHCRS